MSLCHITGPVRLISGADAVGALIYLSRVDMAGQDGVTIMPSVVVLRVDADGHVSMPLYSGLYAVEVVYHDPVSGRQRSRSSSLTVPDQPTALLHEIIDQSPELTPTLVAEARAYRDQIAQMIDEGVRGASAYEVATDNGFTGTEADWLASLVGPEGTAATIGINSVTTGAAGSAASVTNSGTAQAAKLDFVLPKGDTGAPGLAAAITIFTDATAWAAYTGAANEAVYLAQS